MAGNESLDPRAPTLWPLDRQDGQALEYASEELRADHEIVKSAVSSKWHAFRYASEKLKVGCTPKGSCVAICAKAF